MTCWSSLGIQGIQDPGAMASKCGEASPELRDLCEEPWIREGILADGWLWSGVTFLHVLYNTVYILKWLLICKYHAVTSDESATSLPESTGRPCRMAPNSRLFGPLYLENRKVA